MFLDCSPKLVHCQTDAFDSGYRGLNLGELKIKAMILEILH